MPVKFLTVQQALEYFNTLDSVEYSDEGSIVCLPPGLVTDEGDVAENEIILNMDFPKDVCGDVESEKKSKETICDPKWKASNLLPINFENISKLEETFLEIATKAPYELSMMFFDEQIMKHLIEETQRYTSQKNSTGFTLSENDTRKFLAIILFSGYHSLPQEDLYWSNSEDCSIPFVQSAMSRQRFRDIKKFLHLYNNHIIDKTDKLGKVRGFLDMFCKKLQQFGAFSENLSVDEEMIPYTGHHSAKMHMWGKPIKFGYKLWVLATAEGYPLNLQVYVGKNIAKKDSRPLGTRVVLDLIHCIENPQKHAIYMDIFFTSIELLEEIKNREFRATRTIRENRLKDCPLTKSTLLVKTERGCFESIQTKNLCLASNFETEASLGTAKRWYAEEKKRKDLPQPHLISSYNKYMGGMDLLDRFLSTYRPRIKGKKWWWPFFTNTLNMAVLAAWRIHRELKGEMKQLTFLRDVTTALMKSSKEDFVNPQSGPCGPVNSSVRFDGVNHFIISAEKQSPCKYCKKNTRTKSKKCDVMLHQNCTTYFHKRN
ncbi:piggyBac transposable element-derived protein 3-like [Uloborus diversus]|uniref:piggyBac transposable element-derived protein 3-like n=1 Tax=Uloborus diversus TaxID=327109 RepID=UPI002409A290|nr:piggyBac transposable element-derived protein 3-like [Uloborus diversus]